MFLWAAGCGGGCSGSSGGGGGEPVDPGPEGSASSGGAGAGEVRDEGPPPDPGPPPVLRVAGAPDAHSRAVELRVENHGTEEASLASAVTVQRLDGEAWVDRARLELRFSCTDPVTDCVTLAPGAVYLPPPWLGMVGDAQCDCDRCAPAEPGTYRFVVRSCGGAHAVESEPFTR